MAAVLVLKAKEHHVRWRIAVHAPEGGDAAVFTARDAAATTQDGNAAGLHGLRGMVRCRDQ